MAARVAPPGERADGSAGGKPELLSAFVVVALIAVLLTPIAIQQRVHGLRDEIEHSADPARTLVTEVQYLLARQTSVLRGYFLTGDARFLDDFEALRGRETAAYAALGRHVDRLGGAAVAPYAELRTLSREWHDRLDADELTRPAGSSLPVADLPFDQPLYLEALASAARLDRALLEETRERRRVITSTERLGYVINVVLALLAIAAALAVAYLSHWNRRIAREAETRRLAAEEALQAKVDATEARARLLRGVTHDVKNPLGAADAYAELLELGLRGPLSGEQLEFLAKMRRSIRSALDIIHDLLDLGAAESGAIELSRVPTDVASVAREAAEEHRAAAERAGHTLRVGVDSELPAILTDPARVRQVLGNLLSNAIKYTPSPGVVEVAATLSPGDDAPGSGLWIAVRVIDSGPGIPLDSRESIFDEFSRLHAPTVQGHGLGLAISRRIARLLNGEITVGSGARGGSEFVLWLPVVARMRLSRRAG